MNEAEKLFINKQLDDFTQKLNNIKDLAINKKQLPEDIAKMIEKHESCDGIKSYCPIGDNACVIIDRLIEFIKSI